MLRSLLSLVLIAGWYVGPVGWAGAQVNSAGRQGAVRQWSEQWGGTSSHRFLPPPSGVNSVLEQVQMLERLAQMVGQNDEPSPLQLTPKQLEFLKGAVESFRNDQGQLELPDPRSIPPGLIESLLPDPQQREQAKRMLEQYAPSRSADSLQKPAESERPDSVPGRLQPKPSDRPPAIDSQTPGNKDSRDTQSPPGMQGSPRAQAPQDASTAQSDPAAQDSLPGGIPPEYRDLFNRLKSFEQQQRQALEADAPWQSGSNQPDASTSQPSSSQPSSRAANESRSPRRAPNLSRPDSSDGRPNQNVQPERRLANPPPVPSESGARRNSGTNSGFSPEPWNRRQGTDPRPISPSYSGVPDTAPTPPDVNQPSGGLRSFSQDPDLNRTESERLRDPDAARAAAPTAQTDSEPSMPLAELTDSENPFSPNFRAPTTPEAAGQPRQSQGRHSQGRQSQGKQPADPTVTNDRRFNVMELSQDDHQKRNPTDHADMRRTLEQSGLAQSLKRIVEETIKEQEARRHASTGTGTGSASVPNLPSGEALDRTIQQLDGIWSSSDTSTTRSDAAGSMPTMANGSPTSAPPGARSGATSNPMTAEDSRWSRWVNDLWMSIAVVPEPTGRTSSSGSDSALGWGMPQFRWTASMTWTVLIAALLIGFILWMSRKQLAELASPGKRQAEWVRSVLSEGLRTRADVVRVFHLLVRRGQGVSDWWTHRSVVRYFDKHKPQYAAAISELAGVYEQARYYPAESDLSPQQLDQVRQIVDKLRAEI